MFQQSSGRLRKKYWWSNMKMKMCLIGAGVVLFLIIIIVIIVYTVPHHKIPYIEDDICNIKLSEITIMIRIRF